MNRFIALFALAALLLGAAPATADSATSITVKQPWVRASVGISGPTAAFMTIANGGSQADRLLKVQTDAADRVELHRTVMKNGMAMMMKQDGIAVPAGGSVTLKPGDFHVMIMKLKRPIVKGTVLRLVLTFEKAGDIAVDAKVLGHGSRGMMHKTH